MTEDLAVLVGLWASALETGFYVFLRVGAAMALLPAFGERTVPLRVRLGLTLALTLLVAPLISDRPVITPVAAPVARAVSEVVVGLALGIALRLAVMVLQIAGTIAANVVSLSQLLGGSVVDPQPAMSHLLVVGGLALATLLDLHVKVVIAIVGTYDLFPSGTLPSGALLAEWGVAQVGQAFALAFSLSAPFVIASVLYNLALGAINRAMPQLMVAFVGAPAITAGGLAIFWLAAPLILALWVAALDRLLAAPFAMP